MQFTQQANFTRAVKKILLVQDIENLGFRGEYVFVKPGYALNYLIPYHKALFATDKDVPKVLEMVLLYSLKVCCIG